jgi:hypothetical protein
MARKSKGVGKWTSLLLNDDELYQLVPVTKRDDGGYIITGRRRLL